MKPMPTTWTTRIDNPANTFNSDIGNVTFLWDFFDLLFYKRIDIWNNVYRQLITRTFDIGKPIITAFHEAGVYFPQIALSDHYGEIN